MTTSSSSHLHALAPPPPLSSRKRCASSLDADQSSNTSAHYFSEAAYARFSAFGERALGRQHGAAELRRVDSSHTHTDSKTNDSHTNADATLRLAGSTAAAATRKHVLARLVTRRPSGDAVVDARAISAARRLSSLTLPQHETYTALMTKRVLAQRVRNHDPPWVVVVDTYTTRECVYLPRRVYMCVYTRAASPRSWR